MSTSLADKLFKKKGDVHPLNCNLSVSRLFRNKCFKATLGVLRRRLATLGDLRSQSRSKIFRLSMHALMAPAILQATT